MRARKSAANKIPTKQKPRARSERLNYWRKVFNYHYGTIYDREARAYLKEERLSAKDYAILIQHWNADIKAIIASNEENDRDFLEMARYFFNVEKYDDLPEIFPDTGMTNNKYDHLEYVKPDSFQKEREMAKPADISSVNENILKGFVRYTSDVIKTINEENFQKYIEEKQTDLDIQKNNNAVAVRRNLFEQQQKKLNEKKDKFILEISGLIKKLKKRTQ